MMADPSVCHPEITWRALGALGEMRVKASAVLDVEDFSLMSVMSHFKTAGTM